MIANPEQTVKNKKLVMEMMKNIAESSLATINQSLSKAYHSDVEWRGFYPLALSHYMDFFICHTINLLAC